jgi:hypothetical protein
MSEDHDEREEQGGGDDDDEGYGVDEAPRLFRMHGITKVYRDGQLVTRRRIILEDEDGHDVRVLLERENKFGGDDTVLHLDDDELVEFIRTLELVAKRRGLIPPVRLVGTDGS